MSNNFRKYFDELPPYVLKKQQRDFEKRKKMEEEKKIQISEALEWEKIVEERVRPAEDIAVQIEDEIPVKTIAAADEKGLPPLQHKSQHLTSRLAKTARNAKQRSQDIVEEVKEVLQERPKQIMTAAVGGFKVLSSVDFSPAIQKQIQDAIARGNKARRVIKPENEIKQAVHYMNAQVTPHLKAIDKLLLGQSPDRDHLIILNFAHVQQKMGDYLAAHFFKHGIVSHLPQVVRDFMKVFNDNIHNLIGSNLQSSTALSQAKWFISHAICLDFFNKQWDMKIVKLDRASIDALDVQQGVDFIVIDKTAYRNKKVYVPVYLIDAKSYVLPYGEDIRMYNIDWAAHKSLHSALYDKVVHEVTKKVWRAGKIEVMPIKVYINTAYDQFLSDRTSISDNAQILRKNFKHKFNYWRESVYKHIGRDNRVAMPRYKQTDTVNFTNNFTKK